MCYVLLLSTTANLDLSEHNNDLVRFSRELPDIADTVKLRYPHRWYIGSKSRCSCSFRHLYSIELGFGEPVEWYEEDMDDIRATIQVIGLIRRLVECGEKVDCVDAWDYKETHPSAKAELEVDLDIISDKAFRFFENHHFEFTLHSKI